MWEGAHYTHYIGLEKRILMTAPAAWRARMAGDILRFTRKPSRWSFQAGDRFNDGIRPSPGSARRR